MNACWSIYYENEKSDSLGLLEHYLNLSSLEELRGRNWNNSSVSCQMCEGHDRADEVKGFLCDISQTDDFCISCRL